MVVFHPDFKMALYEGIFFGYNGYTVTNDTPLSSLPSKKCVCVVC